MTSLNISLPEAMREFVEAQVAKGRYSTPSEFVRALIRDFQKRDLQEELDGLLLDGIRSGKASPMTKKDWEAIRRRALEGTVERRQGRKRRVR